MDPQLAAATYATVIPVLLLAGYFVSEVLDLAARHVGTRIGLCFVTSVTAAGEFASILGVYDPHRGLAVTGMFGALTAAAGLFTVAVQRLIPLPQLNPTDRDEHARPEREDQPDPGID